MTVLGFGGVFVVVGDRADLEQVSGFHAQDAGLVLFGVGLTIGNTVGGKLADRALMPSLMGILVALAVVMAIFAHQFIRRWPQRLPFSGIAGVRYVLLRWMCVVEKALRADLASTLNIKVQRQ